jgi:hypothetical protein
MKLPLALCTVVPLLTTCALAQSSADLAEQLQNPVSSLTRVELDNCWDFRMGSLDQGTRYTLDFRPVIPFSIGLDWNLIVRTSAPFISQEDLFKRSQGSLPDAPKFASPVPPGIPIYETRVVLLGSGIVGTRRVLVGFTTGAGYKQELRRQKKIREAYAKAVKQQRAVDHHQDGLGDITQSFLFSPKNPTAGGLSWGVGPALRFPAATDDLLGSGKWCAGPEAVALRQSGGWTYGVRATHLWSYAGDEDRRSVNATFVDPFVSFTFRSGTTFGVDLDSAYDWSDSQWFVPLNATISQVVMIGRQPVSFSVGARYTAEGPSSAGEWGLSASVSLLFPSRAEATSLK